MVPIICVQTDRQPFLRTYRHTDIQADGHTDNVIPIYSMGVKQITSKLYWYLYRRRHTLRMTEA